MAILGEKPASRRVRKMLANKVREQERGLLFLFLLFEWASLNMFKSDLIR